MLIHLTSFSYNILGVLFCQSSSAGLLFICSLLPSLFLVVPLFLGLGILLCDNHLYYFHPPYPLFFVSFLSVKHLALYKETLTHLSIYISFSWAFSSPKLYAFNHSFTQVQHNVSISDGFGHVICAGLHATFWCISFVQYSNNIFMFFCVSL